MNDILKRAAPAMKVKPKKPGKEIKCQMPLVDGDAVPHWTWCDDWAAYCLNDMAMKLTAAEAELAVLKGEMQ